MRSALRRGLLALTLASTLILLTSCTGLSGDARQLAQAPQVIGTGVQTNGVAPNRAIDVSFNKDMDPATINTGTFQVRDASGHSLTGAVTYVTASRIASFKPTAGFAASSQYSATITTGAADSTGNHLATNYNFSFATRATTDTSPIAVISVTPADQTVCVDPGTTVKVSFSEGADASTVNTNTITLAATSGAAIAGTVTYDPTSSIATFTPSASLPAQTRIGVTVNGVADLAGVAMSTSFNSVFTTGPCTNASAYTATYQTFDYPGATQTYLYGINDKGDLAGAYNDANGQLHAFTYIAGKFTSFDYPGAIGTSAYGINNFGDVTGQWWSTTGPSAPTHSFVLHNGTMTGFDYPGALITLAFGINDKGVIVGSFQSKDLQQNHGFIRQPDGTMQQFDTSFASNGTSANGINNNGDIAGNPAFVDVGGNFRQLPDLNGFGVETRGLNLSDNVVGVSTAFGVKGYLYVYQSGTYYSVVPPNSRENIAYGINSSGVIVGWYTDSGGNSHGFIATPQ